MLQLKLSYGTEKISCLMSRHYLERLIGLAQELTSTWTAKVTIAFPDYNSFEHREAVLMAKSSFENADFVNSIEVITYKPDFRDEVI